ncbi:signal recognition particle, SRP19 subunit [Cladochytrium replicatum]|nr:signal recognition particle, SRP19 subunit [Cladochytrium replicatum]
MDSDDIENMDFPLPETVPDSSPQPRTTQSANNMSAALSSLMQPPSGVGAPSAQPAPSNRLDPVLRQRMQTWVSVYPVYIDSTKTQQEGRRIPPSKCHPAPVAIYMAEATRLLGLSCVLEGDKRHPRDPFAFGRLRVELYVRTPLVPARAAAEQGKPSVKKLMRADIPTKRVLLEKIAELLPQAEENMKAQDPRLATIAAASRSELSSVIEKIAQNAEKGTQEGQATSGGASASSSSSGGTSGKKKKNKK